MYFLSSEDILLLSLSPQISVLQRPSEIDLKTVAWAAAFLTIIGIGAWIYLK